MLRPAVRAAPSSSLRASFNRQPLPKSRTPFAAITAIPTCESQRPATTHAISNPTLSGIEKRWETMPPQEQADLWMALRDRMKSDWHDLTLQERKAAYWIAFGPHGPRAPSPKGETAYMVKWTSFAIAISTVLFLALNAFKGPTPRTMNEQWQKMTNDYLKSQNVEPITGISSEGYKGKGMVQSKPAPGGIPSGDDE